MKLSLLFLYFFTFKTVLNELIQLKYLQVSGTYNIDLTNVEKNKTFYFEINLVNNYSYLDNFYHQNYNLEDSIGLINFEHYTFHYVVSTGQFKLDNSTIVPINYVCFVEEVHEFNSLSFSYKFFKEEYSLIDWLYKNKKIPHKSFSLVNSGYKKGTLFFGGIPQKIKDKFFNFTCDVEKQYHTWGCKIDKIIFNKEEIINDKQMILSATDRRIKVPKYFAKILNETYFYKHEKNKTCEFMKAMAYSFWKCDIKSTEFFPKIIFVINGYTLSISENLLYRIQANRKYFLIEENFVDPNVWQFGIPLFTAYHTLFDYENSTLTFYDRYPFIKYEKENNLISKFSIGTIGVLVFGLIIIFSVKLRAFNSTEL